MASGVLYITQRGQLALQAAGLAGWTNLVINTSTVLPAPPGWGADSASFTQPTYTGYGQSSVGISGGYVDQTIDLAYSISGLVKFPGPSAGAGTDVVGFYGDDSVTHDVWFWGSFGAAIGEQLSTDLLAFILRLNEDLSSQVVIVAPAA